MALTIVLYQLPPNMFRGIPKAFATEQRAVALVRQAVARGDNLRFAEHHRGIVRRFGRFPHRNAILGRENTPEEQAYLASPEAFKG